MLCFCVMFIEILPIHWPRPAVVALGSIGPTPAWSAGPPSPLRCRCQRCGDGDGHDIISREPLENHGKTQVTLDKMCKICDSD